MKYGIVVATMVACLAGSACHHPITIVTPAGQAAWTKDQVVVRINEIETTTIQAAGTGGMPMATARQIVRFTVAADRIMQASDNGWKPALIAAWVEAKRSIPVTTNHAVATAIASIDLVITAIGG